MEGSEQFADPCDRVAEGEPSVVAAHYLDSKAIARETSEAITMNRPVSAT
jgi:hypothetical protein